MTELTGIRAYAARTVLLACFLVTLPIYSPNIMMLQPSFPPDITGRFAETLLIGAGACSVLCLACFVTRNPFTRLVGGWLSGRKAPVASALLYAIGNVGYAACLAFMPEATGHVGVALAVVVGVSLLPMSVMWTRALGDLDLRGAVMSVSVACVLGALANLVLTQCSGALLYGCQTVLLLLGVAGPTIIRRFITMDPAESNSQLEAENQDFGPDHANHAVSLRAFLSVMGMTILGMAIFSFAMGIRPIFVFGERFDVQSIGMLLGSAALIPFFARRSDNPAYSFLYQMVLPGAAAIAIVTYVATGFFAASDVAVLVIYAFYSMVSVVALATALVVANAREFPRSFVFATITGTFTLVAILGISVGSQQGFFVDYQIEVVSLLTCVYGCFLMLLGCVKSWRLTIDPQEDSLAEPPEINAATHPEPAETLAQRIERVADECRLSPRETEILQYIGRGHSSVYVAKTLLISESTVYTHTRNVYRKVGVASREELIQLLNRRD